MEVTRDDAQESLAAVDAMMQKMRRAVVGSGTPYILILWGIIWFLGFLGSHFFSGRTAGLAWLALDVLGSIGSAVIGITMGRRVRKTNASTTGWRIGLFWLSLFAYCTLAAWITAPLQGRQLAMLILIFVMVGWMAMGFLLSISAVGIALVITVVACIGYFLLPQYFHLWMAILGGGTMIGCGLYIRSKWRQS